MNLTTLTTRRARDALGLLALASLCACGGGGGGSGGTPDPDSGATVAISASNADDVARSGLSATSLGPLASGLSGGLVGATAAERVVVQQTRRAHALALRVLGADRRTQAAATVACAVSGSVTANVTDTNFNGQLDQVGESIAIAANQCDDGAGMVINGSFALTLGRYSDANNFGFDFSFGSFSVTDTSLASVARLSGTLQVGVTGGSQFNLAASSLSLAVTAGGLSRSYGLSAFAAQLNDLGSSLSETLSGNVQVDALHAGQVGLATLSPFVLRDTDDYPSQGVLRISGAAGSALRLEALNALQARVSVDADGDGSYESVKTVNWADLE